MLLGKVITVSKNLLRKLGCTEGLYFPIKVHKSLVSWISLHGNLTGAGPVFGLLNLIYESSLRFCWLSFDWWGGMSNNFILQLWGKARTNSTRWNLASDFIQGIFIERRKVAGSRWMHAQCQGFEALSNLSWGIVTWIWNPILTAELLLFSYIHCSSTYWFQETAGGLHLFFYCLWPTYSVRNLNFENVGYRKYLHLILLTFAPLFLLHCSKLTCSLFPGWTTAKLQKSRPTFK